MNSRPQSYFRTVAFTLVELLTVITIIAILMGLLFPAIGIAKDQARKAEAKNAVAQISAAVKAYYTEYGKYPLGSSTPTPGTGTDVMYGDPTVTGISGNPQDNSIVFNALRNLVDPINQTNYNPRAIIFFDGKLVADNTAPKSGFLSAVSGSMMKGAYVDPWGHEYFITIDANYDNVISNLPYSDFKDTGDQNSPAPRTGVCVFSVGKDGILGSKNTNGAFRSGTNVCDDIVSWQ